MKDMQAQIQDLVTSFNGLKTTFEDNVMQKNKSESVETKTLRQKVSTLEDEQRLAAA